MSKVIVERSAVGSPNLLLCAEADYRNFELTFEVKVDNGLNPGVQIRLLADDAEVISE